jgi:glycosyltransferase involved in cell wall biosynthesis
MQNVIAVVMRVLSSPVKVHVVDPSAYTPPYDHALCAALGAQGDEVALITSHFPYGRTPPPDGYVRRELFYRAARGAPGSALRRTLKLAEHVPDMVRLRAQARKADIVHFQWLAVPALDGPLLPRSRPLVLTAHDVLPREGSASRRAAHRRLLRRFDALIAHSTHGARRLVEELGIDAHRVHVIPHGAFAHLALMPPAPLPPELPARCAAPVVLCFGLLRPYKGLDVLLDAWAAVGGAELWIVGRPRFDVARLRAQAGPSVRWVPRFVSDGELAACFRRADVVVAPYREAEQSGVVATALAFGAPLLLSDVGGFAEVAAAGAARPVPPGDAAALAAGLAELIADGAERERLSRAARALADGDWSWEAVARRTRALYEELVSSPAGRAAKRWRATGRSRDPPRCHSVL